MLLRIRLLSFIVMMSAVCPAVHPHQSHPLGLTELDWRPDPAISRTVSFNYDAHAGQFLIGWRPPGRVETVEGRRCLVGPIFAFDVDDSVLFDDDASISIDFLFDRSQSNGFFISYDRAVSPATRRVEFSSGQGGRWHRETVTLNRARFANRRYGGTDFYVAAPGATYPVDAKDSPTLTLCDMRLRVESSQPRRPNGILDISVLDPDGRPVTVRAGLYDEEGVSPLAGPTAVKVQRYGEFVRQLPLLPSNDFWPGAGRYVFYIDGHYRGEIPAGDYTLSITHGPEFRALTRPVTVTAGEHQEISIRLRRWQDLPASGWYSGDVHIHMSRPSENANESVLAFTRAEDIHVGNLLQMSNMGAWYYPQYAFGADGRYVAGSHALVSGQESPRTPHLGHAIGLNGHDFYLSKEHYYLYGPIAEHLHEDGGLFGYAHIALADVFDLDRGLALDVPLGNVDFLEILQMGMLNTGHFYNFLNLGFHLLPAAGSDFPYIHVAGTERTYVKLPGRFSPRAWFDAWRQGRSFVSNAPVLDFTVNGDGQNSDIVVAAGGAVTITGSARVNPDFDRLARVELVVQGEVVSKTTTRDGDGIDFEYTLQPEHALWFAVRAHGEKGSLVHSSPVYVQVGDDKRFWKRTAVADIAGKYLVALDKLRDSLPGPHADFESFDTKGLLVSQWLKDRPELLRSIAAARRVYQGLIEAAGRQASTAAVSR